jgi:glutaredoxin
MSQRRRILGATLALVILFLVLSTRRSTGAHPRDLRGGLRDVDEQEARLTRIKEPPGKWDPVADRFVNQQGDVGEGKGLQEQIDEIIKQMDDLPDEPAPRRKTPKKNNQQQKTLEDVDSERVVDAGRVGVVAQVDGAGSETKPAETAEKPEEKPAQNVYDATDGIPCDYFISDIRLPRHPHASTNHRTSQIFSQPNSRSSQKQAAPTPATQNESSSKTINCGSRTHAWLIYSTPVPFVVELDKHPHGPLLQAHVRSVTGRGTVPNVIVNGQSIGGGNEMKSLESAGRIAETFLQRLPGRITVDGQSAP